MTVTAPSMVVSDPKGFYDDYGKFGEENREALMLVCALMQRCPKDITNRQIIAKAHALMRDIRDYGEDLSALDEEGREYQLFTKTTRAVKAIKARPENKTEVVAYMRKHGADLGIVWNGDQVVAQASLFWDNQLQRGWPTKDWRASVRTWLGNYKEGRFERPAGGHMKQLMSYDDMMAHARRNRLTAAGPDYEHIKESNLWRYKG